MPTTLSTSSTTNKGMKCNEKGEGSRGLKDVATFSVEAPNLEPSTSLGPDKEFVFIPIPRRLRYDPRQPFEFGLWMNCGLSLASTFLISNLYYCQPLLIQMSRTFRVSYEDVSRIPTLIQAGYAVGLFFICPLGDLVRRRQLILSLIFLTASITIGFATTSSLAVFEVLSFLLGLTGGTPQILVPLAADLATPERRAFCYSIVLTGMLSGLMIARVLAGVIGQFSSWRVVYYMAIGAQYSILVMCYFILPDYPAKNKNLTYREILWSTMKYAVTEPVIIQIEIMAIATSACFSSLWVTLTFLLGDAPYNYSTLIIGLFGLLGLAGMAVGPFAGKLMDHITPWHGNLMSCLLLLAFQGVQTAAGGYSLAAIVIACIGLDALRQVQNVSMLTSIFGVEMSALSRLNALFVLSYYMGQLIGTSTGTKIFVQYGWRACSGFAMGLYAFQILILLLRGPHCRRGTWFGYEGGLKFRKP